MQNHLPILLSILAFMCSINVDAADFPKIGATYKIHYIEIPERGWWPEEVKIIEHGSGAWVLVEFEKAVRRISDGSLQILQPPNRRTQRRWINFAALIGAEETAEQDSDGNAEKPPGVDREP